eukprot:266325-Amphidinium_carterae.1
MAATECLCLSCHARETLLSQDHRSSNRQLRQEETKPAKSGRRASSPRVVAPAICTHPSARCKAQ